MFKDFFKIDLTGVARALLFIGALIWGVGRFQEQINLLDARDATNQKEAIALISATRNERMLQVEELRRRVEAVERSQAASDKLLGEVQALNARLSNLDQRLSELRVDMRQSRADSR